MQKTIAIAILILLVPKTTIQEINNNIHKTIQLQIQERSLSQSQHQKQQSNGLASQQKELDLEWSSQEPTEIPAQNSLKIQTEMFYYGYPEIDFLIYVGDNRYRQTAQLDTMYLTSWISGPKCTKHNCLLCKGDQQWRCEASCRRTAKIVKNYPSDGICQEGIVFVDGQFVTDTIQLGNAIIENFSFVDSTKFQQRQGQLDADFNLAAGLSDDNILNAMKNQSLIGYRSMGIYWSHNNKFITFGGYNDQLVNNDWVHYNLIVNQGAWTLGITDLLLGKQRYSKLPLMDYTKQNYFTFDTSLNGLAMPRKYLHHLRLIFEKHVVVTSKTDFTFYAKCNDIKLLPDVYFQLQGNKRYWKWSYKHYVDWINRGLNDACVMLFYDSGCSQLYAVGYLFFFSNFFYFDQEKRRVSIATTIIKTKTQSVAFLMPISFIQLVCALIFICLVIYYYYCRQRIYRLSQSAIEQQQFIKKQSQSIYSTVMNGSSQN